jgi:hypothetical protein
VIVVTDDRGKTHCLAETYLTLKDAWKEVKGWRKNFGYKATVKSITSLAITS